MRSLPPSLRDFLTGLVIVAGVLLVVEAVGAGGPREDQWVLLPVGAALFTLRQGVRRAVVRRSAPAASPDTTDAPGTTGPARTQPAAGRVTTGGPGGAPREAVRWQEDPVRLVGLAVLGVLALVALAYL